MVSIGYFGKNGATRAPFYLLARPERFELPTARFVAEYSIQLSYGRIVYFALQAALLQSRAGARSYKILAEREGFEPSKGY